METNKITQVSTLSACRLGDVLYNWWAESRVVIEHDSLLLCQTMTDLLGKFTDVYLHSGLRLSEPKSVRARVTYPAEYSSVVTASLRESLSLYLVWH